MYYRRLKRACFSKDLNLGIYDLIAFLRKLPQDAYLTDVGSDYSLHCCYFVFHSSEWDEIPYGQVIPTIDNWITSDDIASARAFDPSHMLDALRYAFPTTIDADGNKFQVAVDDAINQYNNHCICDLKYTGAKFHNPGCPMKKV